MPFANTLNNIKIEDVYEWYAEQSKELNPLIFSSFDVRYSGFKVSVVDANIFPGGFNNLTPEAKQLSSHELSKFIKTQNPNTKKVLIVAESHTRNIYYVRNVKAILRLLEKANFEIRISSLELKDYDFEVGNDVIHYDTLRREGNTVYTTDPDSKEKFVPDFVILNSDLTNDNFEILENLSQPVLPKTKFGWHTRLKSSYFTHNANIVNRFCKTFKLDPWLFMPLFDSAELDLQNTENMLEIQQKIEILFSKIQGKYTEYSIPNKPSIFIKSDNGTYGLGIGVIRNPQEIQTLNKDFRKKLKTIRGGKLNDKVIIQETIPSILTVNNLISESVYYAINSKICGTFYRQNQKQTDNTIAATENLNTMGVKFIPYNIDATQNPVENKASEICTLLSILSLMTETSQ